MDLVFFFFFFASALTPRFLLPLPFLPPPPLPPFLLLFLLSAAIAVAPSEASRPSAAPLRPRTAVRRGAALANVRVIASNRVSSMLPIPLHVQVQVQAHDVPGSVQQRPISRRGRLGVNHAWRGP
jgi:hypothetical protein